MDQLTDRQREVKERLERSMSATEIADELGITRNAVYQQINALRRKGALAPTYTPSGQPPRGAIQVAASNNDESVVVQLVRQVSQVADELDALAARLRAGIGA